MQQATAEWSYSLSPQPAGSEDLDLEGVFTLGPVLERELDLLTFFQSSVAVHLDGTEVHEHVRLVLPLDESVALLRVEPLDRSVGHL